MSVPALCLVLGFDSCGEDLEVIATYLDDKGAKVAQNVVDILGSPNTGC